MDTGRICAVGAADGSTTIVQFSDGLVDMQPNEKQALTSVSPSIPRNVPLIVPPPCSVLLSSNALLTFNCNLSIWNRGPSP